MTATFAERLNAQLGRLRRMSEQHAEGCGLSRGHLMLRLSAVLATVDKEERDEIVFLSRFLSAARELLRSLRASEAARKDTDFVKRALQEQIEAPGTTPMSCPHCGHAHRTASCIGGCRCSLRRDSASCACEHFGCVCARERIAWWLATTSAELG